MPPGVAIGPIFSSSVKNYLGIPSNPLVSDPTRTDAAAGVIADVGVSIGVPDLSAAGGACAGNTLWSCSILTDSFSLN